MTVPDEANAHCYCTVLSLPAVLLQPLRDQSQIPAEQSGGNYNTSGATVIFA